MKRKLLKKNRKLTLRRNEVEELPEAIKKGSVDPFVADDEQVFTLKSTDYAYRVLVETMTEGAAVLTNDGIVTYCNTQLAAMLGLLPARILGKSILDLVNPKEVARLKSALSRSKKATVRGEFQLKRKGKPLMPVLISCNSLKPADAGLCVIVTDLTEEKKSEAALKRHREHLESLLAERTRELYDSAERFRLLVNATNDAIWDFDLASGTVWWNETYSRLFGRRRKTANSWQWWLARIHPDDLARVKASFCSARDGAATKWDAEYRFRRADGEWAHVLDRAFISRDAKGCAVRILGAMLDITEHRRMEESIRHDKSMLDSVMQTTDVMLVLLDRDFNFLWVNRAYARTCRMKPEEMIGKNHFALYPDVENEAVFRKVRDTGKGVFHKDKPFVFPDQPERGVTYWDWSLTPVKDSKKQVTSLVFSLRETTKYKTTERFSQSLNAVNEIIHSTLDPETIMRQTVKVAADAIECDTAAISLRPRGEWKVACVHGLPKDLVGTRMDDSEERHALIALRARKPVAISDAFNDRRVNREHMKKFGIRSVLVVPLLTATGTEDQESGVLFLNFHERACRFGEAHLDFARKLAVSLALALDNARLFKKVNSELAERARTEEKLAAQWKQLQNIIDASPAMIFYKDKENRFLRVNKEYERVTGIPRVELEGKSLYELYSKEMADRYWKDDLEVIRSGKPKRGIIEALETPRGLRTLQADKIPYFDDAGMIQGVVGFAIDITERLEIEEALRRSERRLRMAQVASGAGVWDWEIPSGEFEWSDELFALFGLDSKKTHPSFDSWRGAVYPDDRGVTEKRIEQAIEKRLPLDSEYRVLLPSGEVRWIRALGNTSYDSDGKPLRMTGICIDVTDLKRTQETLLESRRDLERAQAIGSIGNWRLDVQRDKLAWSDENYRIFGVPQGAPLTYESFLSFVHPDDRRFVDEKWKAAVAGEEYDVEHRIIVDGKVKWVREKAFMEFDRDGALTAGFGITQDITMRKEAEEVLRRDKETVERLVRQRTNQLVEAQMELERAKHLSDIGLLAATIAHELRNPLAAIALAGHNIGRKADNPAIEKHLANIGKKVAESNQIINNLLFYSHIKPPIYRTMSLSDVLDESIESVGSRYVKEVSVIKDFDSLRCDSVEADPIQIKEVFNNILNNAFDAVPADTGEIRIVSETRDEFITVRVEDNGPGIAEDIIDKVFDPFFTTKAKGTGLGLSVCRQIVKMHEGEIGITRGLATGTCVFVRLPRQRKRTDAALTDFDCG